LYGIAVSDESFALQEAWGSDLKEMILDEDDFLDAT
jgi:hypothetical protein